MKYLLIVITMGLLSGCGANSGAGGTATTASTGSVSGQLFAGPTAAQTVIAAGAVGKAASPIKQVPDFVVGEAMVQFQAGSDLKMKPQESFHCLHHTGCLNIAVCPSYMRSHFAAISPINTAMEASL